MIIPGKLLISLVAILHIYFFILEMFYWTKPLGMKTFGLKPDFAQASKVLAMNQGLYNGFLAAGLIWSLISTQNSYALSVFFLGCVIVAGVFGGFSANRKILYIQALPAAAALIVITLTQGIQTA